jgi:hypothetical protein
MKIKLKECYGCGKPSIIWKNHEGFRYCKHCWSCHESKNTDTQKPTTSGIPRVSPKRAKKEQEYLKLRARYLTENPLCKVQVKDCMLNATDVHHTRAGADRDVYYLIQSTWIPICRKCHNWVHEHPEEARTMGWLK